MMARRWFKHGGARPPQCAGRVQVETLPASALMEKCKYELERAESSSALAAFSLPSVKDDGEFRSSCFHITVNVVA